MIIDEPYLIKFRQILTKDQTKKFEPYLKSCLILFR